MKVTVCQIDSRPGFLDDQLQALGEHLQHQGSDFLLLPEMGLFEWLAAEPTPDGSRWRQAVRAHEGHISRFEELGVARVCGTRPVINECGSRRNQAYLWTRENPRPIGFHEKYYLPDEEGYFEHSWYDRGAKQFDTARAGDALVGVQICTEMWFFEWARTYAAARVDLLCIPRATPHGSTAKWLAGGQAAAVCAGAYGLSSNLWCPEGQRANLGGLAWVVDPEGNILATTDENTPFVTVEVDLEYSRRSKSAYPRYVPE